MTASPASPNLAVRVITPHSGLNAFTEAISSLRTGFRPAAALAWRFFVRDTRAEHRQSLLGYFWLVFPALANTLTWIFLNNQKIVTIDSGSVPYPLFVLSGTILWSAFNASVMAMLNVVSAARSFLSKVNFPHESLIYAAVLKASTDSVLSALLLIPALFMYGAAGRAEAALFPLALLASLLLGSAIGLIVIPVAALYGDVSRVIQLVLRFGFFLTPVVFALPAHGLARRFMMLNPVTPLIVTGRAWLAGGAETMPGAFAGVAIGSVVVSIVGLVFYKIALPHLIERLGG